MTDDESADRKRQSDYDAKNNVLLGFPENFGGARCRIVERGNDCPHCGFVFVPMPEWAVIRYVNGRWRKPVFALGGVVYRGVSLGSTNRRGGQWNCHFLDMLTCEIVDGPEWQLPDAPCAVADFARAMKDFYSLPTFYGDDLKDAIHVATEVPCALV